MDMACKDYSTQVMWKGWMLWNMTQSMAKMPVYKQLEELSKHMANGTQKEMNLTAHQVASMLNASIEAVVDRSTFFLMLKLFCFPPLLLLIGH